MNRKFYEEFRNTPEGQALLATIRMAEGTERGGPDSYRVMFGGGLAPDLSKHPDKVIRRSGYASSAAGAYQFLTPTWQGQARKLGLQGFGPVEQDIAALDLARMRALRAGLGGLSELQTKGFTPQFAAALAPEWASFPTMEGRSYYGQPVKGFSKLNETYQATLKKPGASSTASDVAAATTSQTTATKPQTSKSEDSELFQKLLMGQLLQQQQPSLMQTIMDQQLKSAIQPLAQMAPINDVGLAGLGFPSLLG